MATRTQSLSPATARTTPSVSPSDALRTNGGSPAAAAAIEQRPRRTSFNFLRRQKSGDTRPQNTTSSTNALRNTSNPSKMNKKQRAIAQEELARQQREAAALARSPPCLPTHHPLPNINAFGQQAAGVGLATPMTSPNQNKEYEGRRYPHQGGRQQTQGRADYHAMSSHVPIPPVPPIPQSSPGSRNGDSHDPYARTESMTHRGRFSYASSAVSMGTINSPRRVRRRKDPTPFNILVIGAKNSGKTSFINFLRTSLGTTKKLKGGDRFGDSGTVTDKPLHPDSPFSSQYLETEIDNERVGVTLWDSQGFERNVVDLQLREMSSFLESRFEETFTEEQKVVRAPGTRDSHIHCVFLILDPVRLDSNIAALREEQSGGAKFITSGAPRVVGGLDEDLDLQVLRTLQGKTTVIPVISKADTITSAHMNFLKRIVWNSLKQAKFDPLEALNLSESSDEDGDGDEGDEFDERLEDRYNTSKKSPNRDTLMTDDVADPDSSSVVNHHSSSPTGAGAGTSPATSPASRAHRSSPSAGAAAAADTELPYLPLSIISPDEYELESARPGRRFPWGFADPYNPEHCDFVRLKESVFSEWRVELRDTSRQRCYEGWRTSRLKRYDTPPGGKSTTGAAVAGGRPSGTYARQGQGTNGNGNTGGLQYGGPGQAM